MARVTDRKTEDCRCNQCGTYAKITEWSCGCVEVDIHNNSDPCSDCTDFSGMRNDCGQSGSSDDHDD